MRGKVIDNQNQNARARITPACAGKSKALQLMKLRLGDHPRMCGEKKKKFNIGNGLCGSPPHVRGKEELIDRVNISIRITPACAGKSFVQHVFQRAERDHPRMCGEKYALACRSYLYQGSPPHVRGKAHLPYLNETCRGITPACAGKR